MHLNVGYVHEANLGLDRKQLWFIELSYLQSIQEFVHDNDKTLSCKHVIFKKTEKYSIIIIYKTDDKLNYGQYKKLWAFFFIISVFIVK